MASATLHSKQVAKRVVLLNDLERAGVWNFSIRGVRQPVGMSKGAANSFMINIEAFRGAGSLVRGLLIKSVRICVWGGGVYR